MQKLKSDILDNQMTSCQENFIEYLNHSSLHALRYVGDQTRSRWERLFFAIMFFLVVLFSLYFISSIWMKWSSSPLIITQSSKRTSVKDIPFPAVTVCNMNRAKKSEVVKFPIDSSEFSVVKSLCRSGLFQKNDTLSQPDSGTWPLYEKVLLNVTPQCENMLIFCEYGKTIFNCTQKFRKIMTDVGLCCVFNAVHPNFFKKTEYNPNYSEEDNHLNYIEWTPERGFWKPELKTNPNSSPRAGIGAGTEMGLSLVMNADISNYFCSSTISSGFRMHLHSPNDFPRVDHYSFAIPNGYESRIEVQPRVTEASQSIRKISRNIRQCYFESENFLQYYRTYSERNCESECEAKILFRRCGCILFFMPRSFENISICGYKDADCVNEVEKDLELGLESTVCRPRCYIGCSTLTFGASFSTAQIFAYQDILKRNNLNPRDISIVHIFYSKSYFRSEKIDELVSFADFLSDVGGLLGLFMGFSAISVIEIFYFVSIRPYFNYRQFSKRHREIISKKLDKIASMQRKRGLSLVNRTVRTNTVDDQNYPFPFVN